MICLGDSFLDFESRTLEFVANVRHNQNLVLIVPAATTAKAWSETY